MYGLNDNNIALFGFITKMHPPIRFLSIYNEAGAGK